MFVWFPYGFLKLSYGFNRPPSGFIGFRGRFRCSHVFSMVLQGFSMVLAVPLVGPSAFRLVFIRFKTNLTVQVLHFPINF